MQSNDVWRKWFGSFQRLIVPLEDIARRLEETMTSTINRAKIESMSLAEIRLRIQVIDINPRQIDITVPRYLAADNLSQRIIRDAGLQSHWHSGYRRNYILRARGRVLHPKETLEQLGVVDGEMIYLLPEPDPQVGVVEQNPEF